MLSHISWQLIVPSSPLAIFVQISLIVEADPEVLCDIRVQSAVEGRFCDTAISVREASLELVGRHIASHPEVGLKVGKIMQVHFLVADEHFLYFHLLLLACSTLKKLLNE